MPKIAFILEKCYLEAVGGAERQVWTLAQALQQRGWQTAYLSERDPKCPRYEIVEGIELIALPLRGGRRALLNFAALRRAMERSAADLFYQRVRHPYTGWACLQAHRLLKPFIFAASSTADVLRSRDLRSRAKKIARGERLLLPLHRCIEDQGIIRADAIVLQTEEQRSLLRQEYGREGVVISNHISLNGIKTEGKASPPLVLWLANVKPLKRPELFVQLAVRCRDLNAVFAMAGACPHQQVLDELLRTQKELPNFRYLGALPPDEAEAAIGKATLLVSTSAFEGFPNTFLQAWARGAPVLSLDVDPDGVINREGLGRCALTMDDLESALRQLLTNEAQRAAISQRARVFVQRNHDIDVITLQYLAFFAEVMNS